MVKDAELLAGSAPRLPVGVWEDGLFGEPVFSWYTGVIFVLLSSLSIMLVSKPGFIGAMAVLMVCEIVEVTLS